MDKVHRIQYYKLIRPMKKYNKTKIPLQPTLSHFLLEYGMERQSQKHYEIQKGIVPHNYKKSTPNLLLEPIMYNVISALLNHHQKQHPQAQIKQTKIDNMKQLTIKLMGCEILDFESFFTENYGDSMDKVIIKFTDSIGSSTYDKEMLAHALVCFKMYQKLDSVNSYTLKDLGKWYTSYTSPNVTDACFSLSNLTEIPGFVVADILLRTPLSHYELSLQMDLWSRYLPTILTDLHHSLSKIRTIITNFVYYNTHYDVTQLAPFLETTVQGLRSIRSYPYAFKIFNNDYRNELLWKIPFDYIQKPSPKLISHRPFYEIIKAQELLSTKLPGQGESNSLTLRAQMGIVLSISYISKKKARSLFSKARSKHASIQGELSKKDLVSFNFLSISLSETPDGLLEAFNNATIDHRYSSTLWLGFIKKLLDFELLTPTRSQQILKKLVDQSDHIILTKNMLLHLLLPIGSFQLFSLFLYILKDHKELIKRLQATLVEKYLILLYANPKKEVDLGTLKILIPGIHQKQNMAIEIARNLYTDFVSKKTSRLVGIMLNGEVQMQPENLYNIYKTQLKQHNLVPDESCLQALINGSMASPTNNSESCFIWDELYAPQVAIHEFRSFTVSSDMERDKITPTDQLWTSYINMLSKYEYVSELSEMIVRWEQINFVPNASTLLALLRALPIEFSKRHIQHIEKVKSDSQHGVIGNEGPISWPWPTIDDL